MESDKFTLIFEIEFDNQLSKAKKQLNVKYLFDANTLGSLPLNLFWFLMSGLKGGIKFKNEK